jgi:NAD(P)-dependent dehydrogenase (short-subunit alcohol dehydrogenase family)
MLFASIGETSEEEYDHQQAVNAKSVFFIIKHALDRLRDGGRIINLSTFFLRIASPQAIAYNVSKAMVDIITPALAWELSPRNITVNAISPGYVETDMTAWIDATGSREWVLGNTSGHRLGTPSDIADVAAFLASHDGRWVNGQVLEASGGAHLAVPHG